MVRSTAIPLLILAGMALTPTEVSAASITYNIVNYPTLQNGFTVSGTITTNGATGTLLPARDITSWDITISGITGITFTPEDSVNFSSSFDATPTTLDVATLSDKISFQSLSGAGISWDHAALQSVNYQAQLQLAVLWSANLPSTDSPIATVPEPSSAVLASIGAVAAFLAYGWSRHRRAQRRQAAA
jgi:hypothetical protein